MPQQPTPDVSPGHSNSAVLRSFSNRAAGITGSYLTYIIAVAVILVWALTGPLSDFSNTWQLAIDTGTNVVTFLMVFLIQSTQNRVGTATQINRDEIIRAFALTDDVIIDTEDATEIEHRDLKVRYMQLAVEHHALK
jgi:low affinity Fe/Cu permease